MQGFAVKHSAVVRAARLIAVAIVIGWSLANIIQHLTAWSLSDMDAYWNAAMRIRHAQDLYPAVLDPAAVDIYKYAPWFAWLWIPVTYLPKGFAGAAWSTVLVLSSVAAIAPLTLHPTLTRLAAATLLGSLLIWSAASGNVQPLLVAILVHTVARRSGPVWVGVAASLKIFPVFYALVYLGRREWLRCILALLVAALLWAPAFAYDLKHFPGGYADSPSPFLAISPVLFGFLALLAVTATIAGARTRYAWLAASASLFASLPRVSLIDLSHLAVGASVRNEQGPG
jgi:hypothetical protein